MANNLREYVVSILNFETFETFMQIDKKGQELREELVDRLREVKTDIKSLKSAERNVVRNSDAGQPARARGLDEAVMETMESTGKALTERCETMCAKIRQEVDQKLALVKKGMSDQGNLIEDCRQRVKEWEKSTEITGE